MIRKKHAPHLHAHHSRHTHAYHVHTHDTLYVRVYTCTHYGRKGHLTKFCYDRLNISNFASKNIWTRRGTNPHGPKKVWVPKITPIFFDVGVGSLKTWETWCLDGRCVWGQMDTIWMHRYQESLVGGPSYFGEIKTSPIGFGNYLYPLTLFICFHIKAMPIRHVMYIDSIWDTPIFIWIHIFVFSIIV